MQEKERLFWANLVVEAYKKIPGWISCMETARAKLISLGAVSTNYVRGMTNEELFDKLIGLNYRMHGLVNLKLLLEEGIKRIPETYMVIMKMKYVDGASMEDISETLGVHRRTLFKYHDKAVKFLADALPMLGYTPEKFEYEYKEEPLLNPLKKRLASEIFDQSSKSS